MSRRGKGCHSPTSTPCLCSPRVSRFTTHPHAVTVAAQLSLLLGCIGAHACQPALQLLQGGVELVLAVPAASAPFARPHWPQTHSEQLSQRTDSTWQWRTCIGQTGCSSGKGSMQPALQWSLTSARCAAGRRRSGCPGPPAGCSVFPGGPPAPGASSAGPPFPGLPAPAHISLSFGFSAVPLVQASTPRTACTPIQKSLPQCRPAPPGQSSKAHIKFAAELARPAPPGLPALACSRLPPSCSAAGGLHPHKPAACQLVGTVLRG